MYVSFVPPEYRAELLLCNDLSEMGVSLRGLMNLPADVCSGSAFQTIQISKLFQHPLAGFHSSFENLFSVVIKTDLPSSTLNPHLSENA
jgi:hypothetical protein